MNPEERRCGASLPEVAESANGHARHDGDEEFGDFEGFEDAAVANIPTAAGPSPWATFPDLLPVQTSPANPPNDEPVCGGQANRHNEAREHDHWMLGAVGGVDVGAGAVGQHLGGIQPVMASFNPAPSRALNNPPDISLISACSSANPGNFNGLDPVSGDPRQHSTLSTLESDLRLQRENTMSLQVNELRNQIEMLTSQRSMLEHQLAEGTRDRQRLADELSASNTRVSDLQAVVQESNSNLRHREASSASGNAHLQELNDSLQQIKDSVEHIQQTQADDRQSILQLQQSFAAVAQERGDRSQQEANVSIALDSVSTDSNTKLQQMIEETVRNCLQEHSEKQQNSNNCKCARHDENMIEDLGLTERFRAELQSCVEQTQELLETERRKHTAILSKTLQTALKQLSVALSSITFEEENNCKGGNS